jgi:opacity protein-like surface antigen
MSYATHNLELGLAWQFGQFVPAQSAAPALPAAPAAPVEIRPAGFYIEAFGTANATSTAKIKDARIPGGTGSLAFDSKRQEVFDRRAGGGFAVGYAFGGGWRTEFEFVYRGLGNFGVKGGGFGIIGDVNSLPGYTYLATTTINGYYDFDVGLAFQGMPIVPYVGAGIGAASVHIDSDLTGIDDRDAAVAYQAMIGAKLRIRPHVYARLGYRYVRTTDAELAGSSLHMTVNDVTFGLGWQF